MNQIQTITNSAIPGRRLGLLFATLLTGFLLSMNSHAEIPASKTGSSLLFDFNSTATNTWEVVNDGVMGGSSKGFVSIDDGVLQFTGNLVTQGGGFTSIRSRQPLNLDGYDGLELRVRGSGRDFEVEVTDGKRHRWRMVSRRAAFPTGDTWQVVRIPFESLQSTVWGQRVSTDPLDLTRIRQVGFYMVDGQDGPFRLEVDAVHAYRAAE